MKTFKKNNLEELSLSEMKSTNGGNWMVEYFNRVLDEVKERMREAGVFGDPNEN